jgi:hypothetical protein
MAQISIFFWLVDNIESTKALIRAANSFASALDGKDLLRMNIAHKTRGSLSFLFTNGRNSSSLSSSGLNMLLLKICSAVLRALSVALE